MARISFSEDQIPQITEKMPVYRLDAPTLASQDTVHEFVRNVAPKAQFKTLGNTLSAAYDGDRLVAFMNSATGESKVFPALEALKSGTNLRDRAKEAAVRIAANQTLFPNDETRMVALTPATLMAALRQKDQPRGPAAEHLSFVRLQRQVNGLPVWGPGTRAMIAVDAEGKIQGFSHRWRAAYHTGEHVVPISRKELVAPIVSQLSRGVPYADVKVDKVLTGYYDGGGGVLQPVLRFEATIERPDSKDQKGRASKSHVFGYISIGLAAEPLPELGVVQGTAPFYAPRRIAAKTGAGGSKAPIPGDPTVGRYVVRNDNAGWVNSANGFMSNLQLANFFGSSIPFTDSQYYWAEPFEYVSDKDSYINSVNIALTESHGNWDLFTTLQNNADFVYLSSIPPSGYGGAGHSLAYWTIHSCEVIPTQTDESTSFNVWWNIFKGLHAVTGYRTEMWINDGATSPFGLSIGLGAPFVSAWLNAVSSDDSYDDGSTYFDDNRDIWEPMGRASAIAVCGHGDDNVTNLGSLGAATCLTEWWFGN